MPWSFKLFSLILLKKKNEARNYWILLTEKILESFLSLREKQFVFLFWDHSPSEKLKNHTLGKHTHSSTHQILHIISGIHWLLKSLNILFRNTWPRISSECCQQVCWCTHISWYVGQVAEVSGLTWAPWAGQWKLLSSAYCLNSTRSRSRLGLALRFVVCSVLHPSVTAMQPPQ